MDKLPDFLKQIMQMLEGKSGTWINVAKLSSADMLKKKRHDMKARRLVSEGRVLYNKLEVIRATLESNKSEFWDGLYKSYSLPSDLSYRIADVGQVLKHVPAAPAENA